MNNLIQSIRLGPWEIAGFVESEFALDGGSMFGVIPRLLWQKLLPPDDENRVPMVANVFVIKTSDSRIVLDTGLGDSLSDFDRKVYAPKGPSRMNDALNALGCPPETITHVILTHLHTDHSNGIFSGDPAAPDLRFPNAAHFVQKDEWDDAMTPNERTDAVYIRSRFARLEQSGKLRLLNGDSEITPGVRVKRTGGHTRGHQTVEVTQAAERFVYFADLIPTRFHLKGPWVAAVDLFPLETMKAKRALLAECCNTKTVIGFDHDTEFIFGRLVQKQKWMDVVPVDAATRPI